MPIVSEPFSDGGLGVAFSVTSTEASFELGLVKPDAQGNFYQYVFADTEAITAGSWVNVSSTAVVLMSDAVGDRIDGFAHVAIPLDEYGWITCKGDVSQASVATGLAIGEFFCHVVNSSGEAVEVPTTYAAATPGVRGVLIGAAASNLADCRLI
jgi:hypothetical protein